MATSFQQDLGGIETPANIEQPIVNQAAATAISGLGNAAHLKIAADNEDRLMELKSAGRGRDSLTQAELEAIDYPRLQAALDQGLLDQTGFQTRLDANLRRVYAAYPERQRAYSSFASSVRSTIVPEKDRGVTTEAEAIKKGQLDALQKVTEERSTLALQLGTTEEAAAGLVAHVARSKLETDDYNLRKLTGSVTAASIQSDGFKLLPGWVTDSLQGVLGEAAKNGGSLPPNQIGMIKARALAALDNKFNEFSSNVPPGGDIAALRQTYDQRRASVEKFADELGAAKISADEKNLIYNTLSTVGAEALTDVFIIGQVAGDPGRQDYYKMQGNPAYRDLVLKNNPALADLLSRTGGSQNSVWRSLSVKLGRGEGLTKEEKSVVGQAGVNAIASPQFNGKKEDVIVPQARKLVESGDVGIVRAWFTPNGLVKLRDPGENGDYYRKQYQGMIDSVKATALTELSDMEGTVDINKNTGRLQYYPSSDLSSGLQLAGQQLLGIGFTSVQKNLDVLSDYALKTPDIATGDSAASPKEALSKVLEEINKRRASFNSPTPTSRTNPATTTTTPTTGGIRIDDQGEVIQ